MAIINYTDQVKYAGRGYLDAKMMPVKTVDDLKAISLTQRFEGLTITVLNDGKPQDYWLVGGITNNNWVPKTAAGDYSQLRLILEDGFLKLMDGNKQMGDAVNLNDFFPENPGGPVPSDDLYIATVDYVTVNDKGATGIFMRFTYSDDTKKYLDMAQFLSQTYEGGTGIVVKGNVISLDAAVTGRIEVIESAIEAVDKAVKSLEKTLSEEINSLKLVDAGQKETIEALKRHLSSLAADVSGNTANIKVNTQRIDTLETRVDSIVAATEGSVPDNKTLTIDSETKALSVKILDSEDNMIKVDENGGGIYATIPMYLEDNELN